MLSLGARPPGALDDELLKPAQKVTEPVSRRAASASRALKRETEISGETGQAHPGRRPPHPGVAGVADLERSGLPEPAVEQGCRKAGRQVGRERDLPVQPRVAGGVNDLNDDVRADVDVVGGAVGGGQRAGVAPKDR